LTGISYFYFHHEYDYDYFDYEYDYYYDFHNDDNCYYHYDTEVRGVTHYYAKY